MTTTFEAIAEYKVGVLLRVLEGLQDLKGQPSLDFPPDAELRKCTSPELVYLIALDGQVQALIDHVKAVQTTIMNRNSRLETLKETFLTLGKCDDSKGGASMGW